ncbi:MAG: hypothetical protein AB1767_05855 [Bacillota bacterium]
MVSETDVWEYCFCKQCNRIREKTELKATNQGIQCLVCKGYALEEPGWVICPHQKLSAVKCPRAGKGIYKHESGFDCSDRCYFRSTEHGLNRTGTRH